MYKTRSAKECRSRETGTFSADRALYIPRAGVQTKGIAASPGCKFYYSTGNTVLQFHTPVKSGVKTNSAFDYDIECPPNVYEQNKDVVLQLLKIRPIEIYIV